MVVMYYVRVYVVIGILNNQITTFDVPVSLGAYIILVIYYLRLGLLVLFVFCVKI
jgi:hypothetical protein